MNNSFEKLYTDLIKEEGIVYPDMLHTIDKDLIGLDLRNKEIEDKNLQEKIIEECKNNIWFFFREILSFPVMEGKYYTEFKINKLSLSVIHCYSNKSSVYINAPRSTYSFQILTSLAIYNLLTENYDTKVLKSACMGRQLFIAMSQGLPQYIKERIEENLEKVKIIDMDEVKTESENIGRSTNESLVFIDNLETHKLYKALTPILMNNNILAKNNKSNLMIMSGIPSKDPILRKKFNVLIETRMIEWNLSFLTQNPFIGHFGNEIYFIKFDYIDLGLNFEWVSKMYDILEKDEDTFNREILLKR